MLKATHKARAVTENPIFGILTQPFDTIRNKINYGKRIFNAKQFITASHVKFLESAGARVIPIDFTLPKHELFKKLEQINGLYIAGETLDLIEDIQYQETVVSAM